MWARIADMANDAIKFEILARVSIYSTYQTSIADFKEMPEFIFHFREP